MSMFATPKFLGWGIWTFSFGAGEIHSRKSVFHRKNVHATTNIKHIWSTKKAPLADTSFFYTKKSQVAEAEILTVLTSFNHEGCFPPKFPKGPQNFPKELHQPPVAGRETVGGPMPRMASNCELSKISILASPVSTKKQQKTRTTHNTNTHTQVTFLGVFSVHVSTQKKVRGKSHKNWCWKAGSIFLKVLYWNKCSCHGTNECLRVMIDDPIILQGYIDTLTVVRNMLGIVETPITLQPNKRSE